MVGKATGRRSATATVPELIDGKQRDAVPTICSAGPDQRIIRTTLSNAVRYFASIEHQEGTLPGTVHVVDDDASFRTAIARHLKEAGYAVATYPSAQQLLACLPDDGQPGCILLDVRIPDLSGPELQLRLGQLGSTLPIVFLTSYVDVPTTVRAIKAGAEDFLTKPVSSEQLLRVVGQALAKHAASHNVERTITRFRQLLGTLTPRERQVFERVVLGKINKQIAQQLGATERTIKAHRHRVMEKMRVQSLAELVSIAERLGIMASIPIEDRNSEALIGIRSKSRVSS